MGKDDDIQDEELNIVLFEVNDQIEVKVCVSNHTTGLEIKNLFRDKTKNKFTSGDNLRIFFGGNEIKDDQTLAQHKVQNDFKLQIFVFKKIDDKSSDNKSKKKNKRKKKGKKDDDYSDNDD